jgi:LysR family cys regulon transcriptional activator
VTLKQLRYFVAVVRHNLNISRAAQALCTSQAAISKQIHVLEEELSVQLFIRHGKRIMRVTRAGAEVLETAERMLRDTGNIRAITADHTDHSRGSLAIAGTPTQIYYALPHVIQRFSASYPQVQISLCQGSPNQCAELVVTGEADLCIATEVIQEYRTLVMLPCHQWSRCIVTPRRHPLTRCKPLTLEEVARYPIITYEFTLAPRSPTKAAFDRKNLKPNVVLTASDPGVIKTYVELGLGIGLVSSTAVDARQDRNFAILDAGHLFDPGITAIGLVRDSYIRQYTYDFIRLFAPKLTRDAITRAKSAH